MIVRDLLELDDEQFEQRIEAVKRRLPQPPGAGLQAYVDDDPDTVPTDHAPMDYRPGWYEDRIAAHAASEIHDDDGTGDGVMIGRTLMYAALLVTLIGVIVMASVGAAP